MATPESAKPPQRSPEDHPIVRGVANGDEGVELLGLIQQQMAEAAAELGFLDQHRDEFEADELLRRGRDVTRSVRALKRFADLEIARVRRFGRPPLRLDDPMVRQVLGLLVARVLEVGHEVLPASKADELDAKFREKLEADAEIPWP